MIDRAPAKDINLLRLKNGCTSVERLETDDDPAIELFLSGLAQELGITNTIMFYERCFMLIEGETELNALPYFYRTVYKRSLLEDGIRIINVKGNGATKEFMRLMGKNKQALTTAFLDKDTESDNRGERARLTKAEFKQAGFSDEFIATRIIYIGTKEFEDSFSDIALACALQMSYPKASGEWQSSDISPIRNAKKMSDALGKLVFEQASQTTPNWGKPELGRCLGVICQDANSRFE
jgi:predicted ATP-dependent endonuclease of OLD family